MVRVSSTSRMPASSPLKISCRDLMLWWRRNSPTSFRLSTAWSLEVLSTVAINTSLASANNGRASDTARRDSSRIFPRDNDPLCEAALGPVGRNEHRPASLHDERPRIDGMVLVAARRALRSIGDNQVCHTRTVARQDVGFPMAYRHSVRTALPTTALNPEWSSWSFCSISRRLCCHSS